MAFRPFQETQFSLGNLQDEMNRLFERVWHAGVSTGPFDGQQWAPVVDLEEFADHYKLYAEVPGVDAGAVELSLVESELTIRGEKTRPTDAVESNRSVRRERRFGSFCRTVGLPPGIDAEKLSATCHNGVLVITVPKSESARPKAIKVSVTDS